MSSCDSDVLGPRVIVHKFIQSMFQLALRATGLGGQTCKLSCVLTPAERCPWGLMGAPEEGCVPQACWLGPEHARLGRPQRLGMEQKWRGGGE